MDKGHYCISVTTTTPQPALHHPHIRTSLHQCCSNGVTVFIQATTNELLPTFCKGSSTLFPTEKADVSLNLFTLTPLHYVLCDIIYETTLF